MEHRNPSPLPEEISSFFEEEKPQEKEEKLIELDEDPSPLIKIPRSSPRSRLQMQLQRPWVSTFILRRDFLYYIFFFNFR